ncbi:hypothetical protein D9757_001034 [Collybiopsis confluens]|uniref:WH1 domain-containing protein n=1 Tax=Collybiopsis confluens TaxID=2823264 RepID=A0A8H5I073_9AGAR|nr:hypothetical protein D9757_001034 [Collybiopsis confluens]
MTPSLSILHPMLGSSSSSQTLAQVPAKLYHAKFSAAEYEWQFFNQRGTILFGQDQTNQAGVGATDPSAEVAGLTESPQTSGLSDTTYWFRLRDDSTGKISWMFQLPEDCSYRIDKPFFHFFSGRSRMWGFLFDNDQEGLAFGELSGITSKRAPSVRSKKSLKSLLRRNNSSSFTLALPPLPAIATSEERKTRKEAVTPAMISLPNTQTFVHIGHIGFDGDGAVECSEGIDPSWVTVITDIHLHGKPETLASGHKQLFKLGMSKKLGPAALRSGTF